MIDIKEQMLQEEAESYVYKLRQTFEWRDTFKPNPTLPYVRSKSGAFNFVGYLKPTPIGMDAQGNEIRVATRNHVALTAISIQTNWEGKAELRQLFDRVLAVLRRKGIMPHEGVEIREGMRDQMRKALVDPLEDADKPLLLVAEWRVSPEWDPRIKE